VPIEYAAQDLAERGGVDAVIVSGPRSPIPPTWERLETVKNAVQLPVLIGSGIGLDNVKEFYDKYLSVWPTKTHSPIAKGARALPCRYRTGGRDRRPHTKPSKTSISACHHPTL
jgi:hypothetical protein